MAALREHTDNRYDDAGGGGGYGKFRRRPIRRPHSTPYDRPPAALRNVASPGGGGGRGWLSRLVDPAQRLITSSAHRLFASVFQKRLAPAPPPPPQPPETEPNQGAQIEGNEVVVTNGRASKIHDSVTIRSENPSISEGGGASELELMLKQQTFTRSEIDRLTALLQSRLLDQPVGDRGNKPEMLMSSATLSSKEKERLCITPVRESEQDSRLISSPYNVGRNVVSEELSNPAKLAKAYMGGGPSKLSPTKICLLGPPLGENSPAPTPFQQKTPTSELVPSSNGQAVYTRNGFVTPRSLGRSAIYSMARTPYSRGVSANTLQAAGTPVDSHGGPSSSSQDTWRNGRLSGLRQGTLKRRSSVFENDIAAVGPIRRIRQKSNLLPASGILSVRGTGLGVHSSQQQPLKEKAVFTGEPSTKNGEDEDHGSAFNSVPSRSSQMASKILQQLNTLVSTPAKSPSKLSPSMLRGPALRSMENVDSSKFHEVVQDGSRLAVQSDTSSPVPQDSISQMDTVEENGPAKYFVSRQESASSVKDVGASNLPKSDVRDVELTAFSVLNGAPENPAPKKRPFRMSAHEEVDEGDSPTAPPSFTLANGIEKSDADLVENKKNSYERSERLPIFELKTVGTSDGPGPEKSAGSMLPTAPVPSGTIQQDTLDKQSTEASGKSFPFKDSGVGPSFFSTGDSIASLKEPSRRFPIFKAADKVPSLSFTSSPSLAYNTSSTTSESPSSLAVPSHVMESVKREPDSKSTMKDALSNPPEYSGASTSSSTLSFSFGASAAGSSLSTGSLAPSPFSSSYGGSSVAAASSIADTTTSSSLPVLVSAPSSTATPILKFGTPSASLSSALLQSSTVAPVSEKAIANGGSFNSMSSVSFSGTSTSFAGTGSNIFGSIPSAASEMSGLFGGTSSTMSSTIVSTPANTRSGSAIVSFSSAATALPSTNQSQGFNSFTASNSSQSSAPGTSATNSVESASVPYQFGSSAPSTSFGLAGNAGFSSGSSLVPSSASDNKLFGSSSIFGLASSAPSSEANALSSSSSATPSLFGSSWQTPNATSLSGSSNTSLSTPFFFGTGTPSSSAASSMPVLFGSSTNASTGLPYAFSSPATTTPLQPVFGNPSSFGIGSSPSGNNDQMSMEDSMAEDTIQATAPAAALFGQQPMPNPSSGFTYGSGTPTPFGSTAPGGASPFQFGGQPSMAAQPNPSPFQASGSLEFAGGSFSLGASGGGGDKSNRKIVRVKKTQRKR